jgi:hypothetical protein
MNKSKSCPGTNTGDSTMTKWQIRGRIAERIYSEHVDRNDAREFNNIFDYNGSKLVTRNGTRERSNVLDHGGRTKHVNRNGTETR